MPLLSLYLLSPGDPSGLLLAPLGAGQHKGVGPLGQHTRPVIVTLLLGGLLNFSFHLIKPLKLDLNELCCFDTGVLGFWGDRKSVV